ncbi:MAG: sulfatase-like hydrolase/transferase [Bacteroidota bacterium]
MKKILTPKFIATTILISFLISCQQQNGDDRTSSPNIVLIFIDDMGYADISSFGATDYNTPNIDRIANEGMRFTNFYVSQAVCSASRASLLTGCYSERVSIRGALMPGSNKGINPDETLIPEMLKEKGYASAIFGKWHLGHHEQFLPLQHGFDEYLGLPYSNDMWPVGYDGLPVDSGKRKSNYPPLPLIANNQVIDTIANLDDQGELTRIYTEKAVEFISKNKDNPFFLYLPHSMVHVPIAASKAFKGKSGKGLFADVMMELDWSVGEVIEALKENDIYDNTLVIFTSDNGPWLNMGNHAGSALPLRGAKGNMWEGGPRVPTVMQWPAKIPAGIESDNISSTIDILPTLAEIIGTELPKNKIDGVSILPVLKGEKGAKPRDSFLFYYGGELIAVRKDNWKLVFPHTYRSYEDVIPGKDGFPGPYAIGKTTEPELYNLENDIGETENLLAQNPEIVRELESIAATAREDLGDRLQKAKGKGVREPGRIQQELTRVDHLAVGKKIEIFSEYNWQYSGSGDSTLINGILGSFDHSDTQWIGFYGNDLEAIIDLQKEMPLQKIDCGFLINQGSWIFSPEFITISLSNDGENYEVEKTFKTDARGKSNSQVKRFSTSLNNKKARYIKISAKSIPACPEWHIGRGEKAWLFVDEIVVQ